jgi:hypothetical protein
MNGEGLLGRASARDGRLVLPDGMSYRYLVLPHEATWSVSPKVLAKIKELVEAGVTVIGPGPAAAPGLSNYPACDAQVKQLADALWGAEPASAGERPIGTGRLIWGKSLDAIVRADGVPPDIEFRDASPQAKFDWIHRRDRGREIYFVSNQSMLPASATAVFRTRGLQPEWWDAVTGQIRELPEWREEDGRTVVPLRFAARESGFVVFQSGKRKAGRGENFPDLKRVGELAGPWQVAFDPRWGGPEAVVFEKLTDWTQRAEEGIRYYSGRAVYRKTFDLPAAERAWVAARQRIFLNLGVVKELAEVKLNGRNLGVVWTAPWRIELTGALKPAGNVLEIDVVNLWPNRLIGDAALPKEKRLTKTNVTTYQKNSPLLPSGLLGPVQLEVME